MLQLATLSAIMMVVSIGSHVKGKMDESDLCATGESFKTR
jgi:hypothetical protein